MPEKRKILISNQNYLIDEIDEDQLDFFLNDVKKNESLAEVAQKDPLHYKDVMTEIKNKL